MGQAPPGVTVEKDPQDFTLEPMRVDTYKTEAKRKLDVSGKCGLAHKSWKSLCILAPILYPPYLLCSQSHRMNDS